MICFAFLFLLEKSQLTLDNLNNEILAFLEDNCF